MVYSCVMDVTNILKYVKLDYGLCYSGLKVQVNYPRVRQRTNASPINMITPPGYSCCNKCKLRSGEW